MAKRKGRDDRNACMLIVVVTIILLILMFMNEIAVFLSGMFG